MTLAGRDADLAAKLSEAEAEASMAQPALAAEACEAGPGKCPAVLGAVLCNLRTELQKAAVRLNSISSIRGHL